MTHHGDNRLLSFFALAAANPAAVPHLVTGGIFQGTWVPAAPSLQDGRRTSVIGLLFLGGPADIPRFVVAIIVDAINRVKGRWPGTNVGKEGGEVVLPFRAHAYSPASISKIAAIPFIHAAGFEQGPRSVFGPHGVLWRIAMNGLSCCRSFFLQAATALRRSPSEIAPKHDGLSAAIAGAEPADLVACGRVMLANHHQSSNPLTYKVDLPHWLHHIVKEDAVNA